MFKRSSLLLASLILPLLLALFFFFVAAAQAQPVDAEGHQWWQPAVFYEIYPRSFADSNNDGVGDLNGITSKMSYLHELGVDAIWITPCYPSPQVDFGYDVADCRNIDPMYGELNEGLRCKKGLWRDRGREQLESFRLAPWASRRRRDLLELLDRLTPTIAELTQAIE